MIQLEKIIEVVCPIRVVGNSKRIVKQLISILDIGEETPFCLVWINEKNINQIPKICQSVVVCPEMVPDEILNPGCTYLFVKNPRKVFAEIINNFFAEKKKNQNCVETSARLDPSVKYGHGVYIGYNTIIEEDVVIGNNVYIGHNNVIKRRTIIEDNVSIGSNNTIGDSGFGYHKDESDDYMLIPHIGNVKICRNAEISNNTCIDRAVIGTTYIGENCKIDNLVHIAHGVRIGRNSLIIANSMIAGSTVIGENVWVSPSSSVLNKLQIGDNSLIGMGTVVIRNIDPNSVVVGNPGKQLKKKNNTDADNYR